jgi:Ser/Thr protein kinase RdoA (MazF antagonist)
MFAPLASTISAAYPQLENQVLKISPFGEGLIHETLLISSGQKKWILQAFNESVFNYPARIDHNLGMLYEKAAQDPLPFQLPLPLLNRHNQGLTELDGKKYRLFDFVNGKTLQQINKADQAYIASKAYGEFASWAKAIQAGQMQETIPNFHRLDLRFETLKKVSNAKQGLSGEEKEILDFYLDQHHLIEWYLDQVDQLPLRVTHNDTKINNLIFSEDLSKVEALIDLDTLMGGYLMYDFGDLVRTVACTLPETSILWTEIQFIPEIFEELLRGYWQGVKTMATPEEAQSLLLGGEIMTLIMGLRFLTDHLQGNIYYRVSYPEQNFHRAKNQMIFLQHQQENRERLKDSWERVTT